MSMQHAVAFSFMIMVKDFHEGLWTIHYYQLHNYWDNLENTALHVAFIGFCQEKKVHYVIDGFTVVFTFI